MIYRFLEFELDEERFEISTNGNPVLTQRKAFDFVRYLLLNRDRVVTHEELNEALWNGAARSLSTIPQCATSVRRALGTKEDSAAVIQTVRGRGYRFVVAIAKVTPSPRSTSTPVREQQGRRNSSRPTFVGREELLATLRAAWQKSLGGDTQIVVLDGEPGIGKTRAVEELCHEAVAGGTVALTGRCYEGEGAPAFWPWIQLMRDWVRVNDGIQSPEGLQEEARLLADWRSRSESVAIGAGEAAEARFRLLDMATGGVRRLSAHTPLVLVLEDLHWADPASLSLLGFIAAHMHHDRVFILATCRTSELHNSELSQILGDLAREPGFRRIPVEGLEAEHVEALLTQIVGDEVTQALTESVVGMTEGNPFFVVELARVLDAEGARLEFEHPADAARLELPANITATIGRRLARLTTESRQLLTMASVIGRNFGTMLLAEVAQEEHEVVLKRLEEPVEAGILEPARNSPDAYRFNHALIRETLYRGMHAPSRARHHGAVARALESFHGDSTTVPLAELAHHWYEAVATGAVEKAGEYCTRAGLSALSRLAFEEAASHLKRALELAHLGPVPDDDKRCGLLLSLGQAQWSAGEHAAARSSFARTAALARRNDSKEQLARSAIGYYGFEQGLSSDATTRGLLEEAVERLDANSPALRACLLTKLMHMTPYADSMEKRKSMSLEALELARSCGDQEALREAFRGREMATVPAGFLDERLEWEEECRDWGARLGDPWLSWFGNDLVSPLALGDRDGVLHALQESSRFARAAGHHLGEFIETLQQSGLALMEGRFDDLDNLIEQIPEAGRNCVSWAPNAYHSYRFLRVVESGRVDRLKQDWLPHFEDQLTGFESRETIVHAAVALIRSLDDDPDAALTELDWILGSDFSKRPRNENWLYSMQLVAVVIERSDAKKYAEILLPILEPFANQMSCHASFRWTGGSTASRLGMLCSVLDNFDEGTAYFEAGLAQEIKLGARCCELESRAGLARLLVRRGHGGDKHRARTLMKEVVSGAEQLGIDPRVKYVVPFERLQSRTGNRQESASGSGNLHVQ